MGRNGSVVGKLALALLLVSFFMAGTNLVLFSSVITHEDENQDRRQTVGNNKNHPKPVNGKTSIDHRTTTSGNQPHNPSNLFKDKAKDFEKQKQSAVVEASKPSKKAPQDASKNMPRNEAIYTCSYGISKENRTSVEAPKHEPSFVIIGVQKSGSTALLTHFRDHPQVLQTKHKFRREAHFFDTSWMTKVLNPAKEMGLTQANDKHCLALQEYMKLFETETILANSQTMAHEGDRVSPSLSSAVHTTNATHHLPLYTFEKTPSYFGNPKIPARMKLTVPWSKIILVLRNPTERLYSQYKMTITTDYNMRKYSLEDFVYHELKGMKEKNMTTAPLMVPINITEGHNKSEPEIPVVADHYEMPAKVPFDHAIFDSDKWISRERAIHKSYDSGPMGRQILVRRGLYNIQLKWWLKHYTLNENFMVLNYDELLKDIRAVYEKVCHFAGIPLPYDKDQNPSDVGIDFDQWVRKDHRKDSRPLREETRKYLSEFYAPYTAELEALLGPEWSPDKLGW